jgi:hypothetical protein
VTFQTRDTATGGGLSQQATYPLSKGFRLDGFLGVKPRSVGFTSADGLCYLGWGGGESLQLNTSMIGEGRPYSFQIIPQ